MHDDSFLRPCAFIQPINEAGVQLCAVVSLDYESFINDETLKRSFVRSLEIIGEASRNVPENFRKQHPTVEWKAMASMRDVLIHSYFGVDYLIVWDVVSTHIPELLAQINHIIENDNL